jgi:hypothetical protein
MKIGLLLLKKIRDENYKLTIVSKVLYMDIVVWYYFIRIVTPYKFLYLLTILV